MEPTVWLQVETKARVLIKELIEPTIRRVSESNKQIEELSQFQLTLKYKLEDMESVVSNIEKRLLIIDEFSKKMNEFEAFQVIAESKFNRNLEEIKSLVYSFSKKQITFEEDLQILQKQRESLKDDVMSVSSVVLNNRFELEEQIEQVKQKAREETWNNANRFEMIEKNSGKLEKQLTSFSNNLAQNESTAKEALRLTVENGKHLKKVEKKIIEQGEKSAKDLEKVRNIAIVNTSEIVKLKTDLKKTQEKVKLDENGTAVKVSITEPLYLLFKDLPTLKVLAEYDKDRLSMINTNLYSQSLRESAARLKVKAQEIIDTPLPVKRHDSNSSSVKRKRKERVKNLKKQMAASIARNTLKNQKEEPVSKAKKKPNIAKTIQNSIKSSVAENQAKVEKPEKIENNRKNFENVEKNEKNVEKNEKNEKNVEKNEKNFEKTEKTFFTQPNISTLASSTHATNQSLPSTSRVLDSSFDLKSDPEVLFPNLKKEEKPFSSIISEAMSQVASEASESDSELDNFIDFTPMINMVKETLETRISSIHSELKSSISSTDSSLTQSIIDVKSHLLNTILSIKSNHELYTENIDKKISEVEVCIQQAVYECNSASVARKRDHSDFFSQIKQFLSSLDEVTRQEAVINENIENMNKTLDSIIDLCKITVALQGQDENDRESIFLMGTREGKKGKTVTLDKRCLSCAGQSSSVISAFKIACLAYEPSAVLFQDKRFSRKELFAVQKNLLKNFNKSVSIDTSDEREGTKGVMTSRHWRPLSVPVSNFSTLTSPYLRTPDTDNLPFIRKSLNN